MPRVTDVQRAEAARQAGFPEYEIPTAVAVSIAEVRDGNSDAINPSSGTKGLWQIHPVHAKILASGNWRDPVDNARMAKAVWDEAGQKWTPWTTYKSAYYVIFLPRGRSALAAAKRKKTWDKTVPGDEKTIPERMGIPGAGTFAGISKFFAFITNPHNWVRVGYIVAGFVLILVAVIQMSGITGIARKALPV